MADKMSDQFQQNSQYQKNNQQTKKEGEVTVEGRPKSKPKFSNDDGEYVDYENVD